MTHHPDRKDSSARIAALTLSWRALAAAPFGERVRPTIVAIGAENEYANVLSQIGGKYVSVSSILNNPNTDPHTFEASASVAEEVARAQLIVQNGVGYDSFMNNIEAASPNSKRKVIVVQDVLDLPTDTPNPHLWYKPTTMPAVAKAMVKDLDKLAPSHAAYFRRTSRPSTRRSIRGSAPSRRSNRNTPTRPLRSLSRSRTIFSRRWAPIFSPRSSSKPTS